MNKFKGILVTLLLATTLPVFGYNNTDPNLRFGKSGEDVIINIGGGQLKWNNTLGQLEKSNDGGQTTEEIGAGGTTSGALTFNFPYTENFDTNAPTTLFVGDASLTVVDDTVTNIEGATSFKLTQSSASAGHSVYLDTGNEINLTTEIKSAGTVAFDYLIDSNAGNGDLEFFFEFYNGSNWTSYAKVKKSILNGKHYYTKLFDIPSDATKVRWGIEVVNPDNADIVIVDKVDIDLKPAPVTYFIKSQNIRLDGTLTRESNYLDFSGVTDDGGAELVQAVNTASGIEIRVLKDCELKVTGSAVFNGGTYFTARHEVDGSSVFENVNYVRSGNGSSIINLAFADKLKAGQVYKIYYVTDSTSNSMTNKGIEIVATSVSRHSVHEGSSNSILDTNAYTPTFQGFGTPTNVDFTYRISGDSLVIQGRFTTGTATAVEAQVSLPSGYTVKGGVDKSVGIGLRHNPNGLASVLVNNGNSFLQFNNYESSGSSPQNGNAVFGPSENVSFTVTVPVNEIKASDITYKLISDSVDVTRTQATDNYTGNTKYFDNFEITSPSSYFTCSANMAVSSETSSPLEGLVSSKLTQSGASASDSCEGLSLFVDKEEYKTNPIAMKFIADNNGIDNDYKFIVEYFDGSVWNNINETRSLGGAREYSILINVPDNAVNVRVKPEIVSANDANILYIDKVRLDLEPQRTTEFVKTSSIEYSANSATLLDLTGNIRFESAFNNSLIQGDDLFEIVDDVANSVTKIVAKSDCVLDVQFSVRVSNNHILHVIKNGLTLSDSVMFGTQGYTATAGASVSGPVKMSAGDWIAFSSDGSVYSNSNMNVNVVARAISPNVVHEGSSSILDWTPYTPTFTGVTLGSVNKAWYRLVNDSIEVKGFAITTGDSATHFSISLPDSLEIDDSKINASRGKLGELRINRSTTQSINTVHPIISHIFADGITNNVVYGAPNFEASGTDTMYVKTNASAFIGANVDISFDFTFPLKGSKASDIIYRVVSDNIDVTRSQSSDNFTGNTKYFDNFEITAPATYFTCTGNLAISSDTITPLEGVTSAKIAQTSATVADNCTGQSLFVNKPEYKTDTIAMKFIANNNAESGAYRFIVEYFNGTVWNDLNETRSLNGSREYKILINVPDDAVNLRIRPQVVIANDVNVVSIDKVRLDLEPNDVVDSIEKETYVVSAGTEKVNNLSKIASVSGSNMATTFTMLESAKVNIHFSPYTSSQSLGGFTTTVFVNGEAHSAETHFCSGSGVAFNAPVELNAELKKGDVITFSTAITSSYVSVSSTFEKSRSDIIIEGETTNKIGEITMQGAELATPNGFLYCDGSAVSRTAYADLFAKIGTTYGVGDGSTTFNLPDFRGYFPRGFDDGRGVDTGRVFGASQDDSFQGHWHELFGSGQYGSTAGSSINNDASTGVLQSNSRVQDPVTDGVNGTPRVAGETRPKNIAVKFYIRYQEKELYLVQNDVIEPTITKNLNANFTSSGVMTDLTFSDLEVGAEYEVSGNVAHYDNGLSNGNSVTVNFFNNGTNIHRTRVGDSSNPNGVILESMVSPSFSFVAQATTMTVEATIAGSAYVQGNGSRATTYIQLTKKNKKGVLVNNALVNHKSGVEYKLPELWMGKQVFARSFESSVSTSTGTEYVLGTIDSGLTVTDLNVMAVDATGNAWKMFGGSSTAISYWVYDATNGQVKFRGDGFTSIKQYVTVKYIKD